MSQDSLHKLVATACYLRGCFEEGDYTGRPWKKFSNPSLVYWLERATTVCNRMPECMEFCIEKYMCTFKIESMRLAVKASSKFSNKSLGKSFVKFLESLPVAESDDDHITYHLLAKVANQADVSYWSEPSPVSHDFKGEKSSYFFEYEYQGYEVDLFVDLTTNLAALDVAASQVASRAESQAFSQAPLCVDTTPQYGYLAEKGSIASSHQAFSQDMFVRTDQPITSSNERDADKDRTLLGNLTQEESQAQDSRVNSSATVGNSAAESTVHKNSKTITNKMIVISHEENQEVRCVCGSKSDYSLGYWMLCDKCKFWTHSTCHGFYDDRLKMESRNFTCYTCFADGSPSLLDILQNLAIARKVTQYVWFKNEYPDTVTKRRKLAYRTGVAESQVLGLLIFLHKKKVFRLQNGEFQVSKTREPILSTYMNPEYLVEFLSVDEEEFDANSSFEQDIIH